MTRNFVGSPLKQELGLPLKPRKSWHLESIPPNNESLDSSDTLLVDFDSITSSFYASIP